MIGTNCLLTFRDMTFLKYLSCRRGLEFENIDPNLYQFCNKVISEMRVSIIRFI